MRRKTAQNRAKSSQPDESSVPAPPITADGRKKRTEPSAREQIAALEYENAELVVTLGLLESRFYQAEERLHALEQRPVELPTGLGADYLIDTNRRTRRYAVVSHDQLSDRITKALSSLATLERDNLYEHDELFERLQAVEQYIRADHAIQASFRYSNLDEEHRTERVGWRRFRDQALDRIGRITRVYIGYS